MALVVSDRVMETSITTGTGAFTLAGAYTGYRAFSAVCSTSDTIYYVIEAVDVNGNPSGDWEVGLGTYSSSNTLTRTTPLASTNANAAVNFAAGTKRVFGGLPGNVAALRTILGLGTAALQNTGTSGANVPLLNGTNTHSGLATFSAGADMTPATTPSTTAVGYLGAPINTQNGTYGIVMADAGCCIYHTSGSAHTWTLPANGTIAMPIGTVIVLANESGGGVVTVAITTDTLRWGSSTGSRSLAANGTATLIKVASQTWRMTGDGIT